MFHPPSDTDPRVFPRVSSCLQIDFTQGLDRFCFCMGKGDADLCQWKLKES